MKFINLFSKFGVVSNEFLRKYLKQTHRSLLCDVNYLRIKFLSTSYLKIWWTPFQGFRSAYIHRAIFPIAFKTNGQYFQGFFYHHIVGNFTKAQNTSKNH